MAQGFSVDLDYLKEIHSKKLPLLVTNFDESISELDKAADETAHAFEGGSEICQGVQREWAAVSMFLLRVMQRNREVVELTCNAVKEVERRYRELDGLE